MSSIFEDRDGALWLCTLDRGLLKLDRERKTFTRYAKTPGDPNSLPNDSVHSLLRRCGRRNVGRYPKRVEPVPDRRPPSFVNYKHEAGNPNSLHDNDDLVRTGGQPGIPLDRRAKTA